MTVFTGVETITFACISRCIVGSAVTTVFVLAGAAGESYVAYTNGRVVLNIAIAGLVSVVGAIGEIAEGLVTVVTEIGSQLQLSPID